MANLSPYPLAQEQPARLSLPQLEEALQAVDPTAVLVPPRILRRVIKENARIGGIGLRVPHRKTYVISREELLSIVDLAELDLPPGVTLTKNTILIARPSLEDLASMTATEALIKYWRLLFHARVHVALDELIAQGRLTPAVVRERISQLGLTEFDEARTVLKQEDYLLPPVNDVTTYVEFAAVYLELRHFAANFLSSYFPAIEDFRQVDDVLKQDFDVDGLLHSTRLAAAPDPALRSEASSPEASAEVRHDAGPNLPPKTAQGLFRKLIAKAARSATRGNVVRAAILRTRAARFVQGDAARQARSDARDDLGQLARRLQRSVGLSDVEVADWSKALPALVDPASRGVWTPAARLLYDLQKVCVDHERGIYALDLLAWAKSLGRVPIKRHLPGQRDVLISKHLRGAAARLRAIHLSPRTKSRLQSLLQSATSRAEGTLRAKFRPLIVAALDEVRLMPQNLPERVARKKLVEELLDRIVDKGFLSMGDLRDALSRNNLKMPDLAQLEQLIHGDQLLQVDRRLGASLDGVYHPGEIYLRLPQLLSSLGFGTRLGRFLTRYLALPFGGAFIILAALEHIGILIAYYASGSDVTDRLAVMKSPAAVAVFGFFLLGLFHRRGFRKFCLDALWLFGRLARTVLIDVPAAIRRLPAIEAIVNSPQFRLLRRYVVKPLVLSAVAALLAWAFALPINWSGGLLIFLICNVLLNSRIGRKVDEMLTDWATQTWHRIRIHVFAALFRLITDVFNSILEGIERLLYTVDEWLRFRAGERPITTLAKAILGVAWFFVSYLIRFCVTLLLEPQFNPIKHFPVVTVSHKILIGFGVPKGPLATILQPRLGWAWANTVAGAIILAVPGVFGFLVWELKENWRLYEANRPKNLTPVAIGHHGESMIQFMRPGFRSGTLPKLYAKLRKANRKAYWTGNWRASGKHIEGLHHLEEYIRRFVDRELLMLLQGSQGWGRCQITTGEIQLGTNRILIELYCPELAEESLWLAMEERSGWLVAGIHKRGWLDVLTFGRRQTLSHALAGFYKMAGVDLIREQIESHLGHGPSTYEIADEGLIVWRGAHAEIKEVYDPRLGELTESVPPPKGLAVDPQPEEIVFARTPISWRRWVLVWELDQDHLTAESKRSLLDMQCLLPSPLPRT